MRDREAAARELRQVAEFEQQADQGQATILGEFFDFLLHNKKWWLTPIVLVILIVGLLTVLGSSAAAPFIYTLY
jgi:hypothetical protein